MKINIWNKTIMISFFIINLFIQSISQAANNKKVIVKDIKNLTTLEKTYDLGKRVNKKITHELNQQGRIQLTLLNNFVNGRVDKSDLESSKLNSAVFQSKGLNYPNTVSMNKSETINGDLNIKTNDMTKIKTLNSIKPSLPIELGKISDRVWPSMRFDCGLRFFTQKKIFKKNSL